MNTQTRWAGMWTILLLCAGLIGPVQQSHGQAIGIGDDVELPFMGVVIPEEAELRAGPGKAYYPVGQLEAGSFVTVHEGLLGWFKISTPEGVYSYVSKAFVNAESSIPGPGEVTDNRVQIKAASDKGPGWSFKSHATLNTGDSVTIVSEEGRFYKILQRQTGNPSGKRCRNEKEKEPRILKKVVVDIPRPRLQHLFADRQKSEPNPSLREVDQHRS